MMAGKFSDISGVYPSEGLDKLIDEESPFRQAIRRQGGMLCPQCGSYQDLMWHLEWRVIGRMGVTWMSSEANQGLAGVVPEWRWTALRDFVANFGVVTASYRVVYGPPGAQIVVWEKSGTFRPIRGEESRRCVREWRDRWGIPR